MGRAGAWVVLAGGRRGCRLGICAGRRNAASTPQRSVVCTTASVDRSYPSGGAWQGFLTWINCILSRWNSLHQSALLLFQTQASVRSVLAVSLLAAFCAGQLSYRLAARRRVVLCGICGAVLLLLQLAADTVSAWSCALYFGAFLGLWMFGKEASPLPQARRLWIGCMAVLCLCAAITPFCLCNMGSCWPSLYESQWQCQITKPFVSRFFVEYCAVNRPKRRQVMSAEA